jgi:hypothetical protein
MPELGLIKKYTGRKKRVFDFLKSALPCKMELIAKTGFKNVFSFVSNGTK